MMAYFYLEYDISGVILTGEKTLKNFIEENCE